MGGVHAWLAAERLDAQPRVVRERGQARGAARVPRLGERVLEEGLMRRLRLADAELQLRHELDRQRRKQCLDLADLSGVARGENQPLHQRTPSALLWWAMSSAMPWCA